MPTVIVVRTRHRYYLSLTAIQVLSVVMSHLLFSQLKCMFYAASSREATKNIKTGNSQAALMEINMTRQAMTLAGLKLNITVTSIATKKSVSILPSDDKDEIMTSNPFQAAISLWQNYTSAWFRVWNEFLRYPTAITGEIGFFRLNVFVQSAQ